MTSDQKEAVETLKRAISSHGVTSVLRSNTIELEIEDAIALRCLIDELSELESKSC